MRRKPYTEIGIRRKLCIRGCGRRAVAAWQICADGRVYRPICQQCDIELNEMVMRWVWGETREDDLRRYRERELA